MLIVSFLPQLPVFGHFDFAVLPRASGNCVLNCRGMLHVESMYYMYLGFSLHIVSFASVKIVSY